MSRRSRLGLAMLPLIALLLGGAGEPPAPAASEVIAQRGVVRLTAGEVRDLVERADPQTHAQLLASPAALAAFVRERLLQLGLVAEARAKGWDLRPEMVQRMNEARDAVLAQGFLAGQTQVEPGFPTEADITATYEANKARFQVPKQYNLAQIAVPVPQGAARDADEDARRKAADLRAQTQRPKADFAEIARKNPQEGTGVVGWVREDQLVPGIKEAVMALADGAVSEPLRTQTGWHVVKLLGTRPAAPAAPAALADVHDQIAQALRQARQQQAARAYVDDMLKHEPIQLNEIALTRAVAPR